VTRVKSSHQNSSQVKLQNLKNDSNLVRKSIMMEWKKVAFLFTSKPLYIYWCKKYWNRWLTASIQDYSTFGTMLAMVNTPFSTKTAYTCVQLRTEYAEFSRTVAYSSAYSRVLIRVQLCTRSRTVVYWQYCRSILKFWGIIFNIYRSIKPFSTLEPSSSIVTKLFFYRDTFFQPDM